MAQQFEVPVGDNEVLELIVERINNDAELKAYWRASNITAIDRLGYNDHGPIHIKIVAKSALRMLRLLVESGETPDIVKAYSMGKEDAEVVVVLAAALHDIGHAIHREGHEEYSIALAPPIIKRLLKDIYDETELTIVMVEILHAMITHRSDLQPLTLEASVVRVADALDMEKGRARIPFKAGSINIHSVSALAIDKVRISKGDERPIKVEIMMNNSAGIYQIDELLRDKIAKTSIRDKITIVIQVPKEETKIVQELKLC
jgi:metal-dependent HD superfamily phosphatase/phosphodiesterase